MKTKIKIKSLKIFNYIFLKNAKKNFKSDLSKPALIFVPHQDDETLGCGGTIIKKVKAGAKIKVIFLCDASRSHFPLIPELRLKEIRKKEAIEALKVLGVNPEDIIFLDFKETKLFMVRNHAIKKVMEIIKSTKFSEIYLPYRSDDHQDHVEANKIVLRALERHPIKIDIFEYAIWYWYRWPFVSLHLKFNRETITALKKSFSSLFGLKATLLFRSLIHVSDVLQQKKIALEKHRSQMTKFRPDKNWKTLHDIADGEFLSIFFSDHELFYHYKYDSKHFFPSSRS
jgi:LmbE family N-acetylglucosaminyl deacetylase